MLQLLRELFSSSDGWMFYRITVGIGTLLLGVAAILAVHNLGRIASGVEKSTCCKCGCSMVDKK